MRKALFSIAIVICCLGSLSAQKFIGKINPYPTAGKNKVYSADSLRILAVMVDFKEAKDGAIVGTGKFGSIYSKDYGKKILDPLPFDKAYFSAHLEFTKNYFEKVSGNRLKIGYTVLPNVVSLSKTIRSYSPAPKSADFSGLGEMSKEVWAKADSANPGFDFNNYDLFVIFHAGVGRDVSLPGSLGTERDIPSVYLGDKALKKIYGSSFTGFPVSGGSFNITNSLLLPCTESREITSYGTTYLFQITINGLIVSSIASHLGLPDLFNTTTGITAIGRFGLMDGQSIFGYAGIFPPEPSAWEKMYLGWATPVTVDNGSKSISLAAELAASASDTTILKVPINSNEYFLVENRNRDVNKDGAKITCYVDGNYTTKVYPKDTTGFNSSSADSIAGIVTNVDEYDWALPGNGIVIWHIDDGIINSTIADDKINADDSKRGVDVEEADGIQDIGQQYTNVFGDVITGEGTEYDFWYSSNKSSMYKNRFDKTSRPNSNSNTGAYSLVSISNFSDIANKMSLKVAFGDSLISPVFTTAYAKSTAQKNISYTADDKNPYIIVLDDKNLTLYSMTGAPVYTRSNFSDYKPSVVKNADNVVVTGLFYDKTSDKTNVNNLIISNGTYTLKRDDFLSAAANSPLVYQNSTDKKYYATVPVLNGSIITFSIPQSSTDVLDFSVNVWASPDIIHKIVRVSDNEEIFLTQNSWKNKADKKYTFNAQPKDLAVFNNVNGNVKSAVVTSDGLLSIINSSGSVESSVKVTLPDTVNSKIAVADLQKDGENYILFIGDKKLQAVNPSLASAVNYPFTDPAGTGFTGTPLAVDFANDKKPEAIAVTSDGRIFAIDGATGKTVNGFPISTGDSLLSVPVVFTYNNAPMLAVATSSKLYCWSIGSVSGTGYWTEENGNAFNNSLTGNPEKNNSVSSFFPKNKVYNYPNPAYNGVTSIRYYVGEDSKINIKIFDLAGDYVAELNNTAMGGMDNETVWNLKNIQSGIYLARIEAKGISGKTENTIIKIAVVK